MALKIRKYPDKALRKKSKPVEKITGREIKLFEDMLFAMRHSEGIGLAAPQVGVHKRIIVIEIDEKAIRLANPEVIKAKGKNKMTEGCLSVPDVAVDIERPSEIVVRGLNEKGERVEFEAKELLAKAVQHEIDHLNGILIVDYM